MIYPKIGIRPTIDGRWGGVRESLETQTMGMAKRAAALISENLRYPDGTPVQCVIADSTIGGGAVEFQAVQEAKALWEQGGDVTMTRHYDLSPDAASLGMVCGGSMDVEFIVRRP